MNHPKPGPNGAGTDQGDLPAWLEMIDHTADAGIIVVADDLKLLFSRAAWGMFAVITDPGRVKAAQTWPVAVGADDLQALMVRWLAELNFRHVTQHVVFGRFDVKETTDTELRAEVSGEPIDSERHLVHTEIKAVTFHGMRIERGDGAWRAEIIFDL